MHDEMGNSLTDVEKDEIKHLYTAITSLTKDMINEEDGIKRAHDYISRIISPMASHPQTPISTKSVILEMLNPNFSTD